MKKQEYENTIIRVSNHSSNNNNNNNNYKTVCIQQQPIYTSILPNVHCFTNLSTIIIYHHHHL